mmetsp:Transcript_28004/g.70878  ORF Transcript_28004/g.70878 Transcript_28004/m.70878 type:complete len:229 (-) Transcript_28004:264-950(-)
MAMDSGRSLSAQRGGTVPRPLPPTRGAAGRLTSSSGTAMYRAGRLRLTLIRRPSMAPTASSCTAGTGATTSAALSQSGMSTPMGSRTLSWGPLLATGPSKPRGLTMPERLTWCTASPRLPSATPASMTPTTSVGGRSRASAASLGTIAQASGRRQGVLCTGLRRQEARTRPRASASRATCCQALRASSAAGVGRMSKLPRGALSTSRPSAFLALVGTHSWTASRPIKA